MTIQAIIDILTEFSEKVRNCKAKTEAEYNKSLERYKSETKLCFMELRREAPELVQINYDDIESDDKIKEIIRCIEARTNSAYAIDKIFPNCLISDIELKYDSYKVYDDYRSREEDRYLCNDKGYRADGSIFYHKFYILKYKWENKVINGQKPYYRDEIQHTVFITPSFCPMGSFSSIDINILKGLIFNVLLSLPIRGLHFSLIGSGNQMFNMGEGFQDLYNFLSDEISEEQLYEKLELRKSSFDEQYEDLVEYNTKNKTFLFPYEIVLIDSLRDEDRLFGKMDDFKKYGFYFFFYYSYLSLEKMATLTRFCDDYKSLEKYPPTTADTLIYITPLYEKEKFRNSYLEYLNFLCSKEIAQEEERKRKEEERKRKDEERKRKEHEEWLKTIHNPNYQSLCREKYQETTSCISIPIGYVDEQRHYFQLDTISHVHSFILGQSGSGKSVLLHNIILGAITTYAPEELMLYLLDLKMGGVEFNRYQNVKHVRALLVDNSDLQITVEFLRDLYKLMDTRGKQLRNAGVTGIEEYNKKFPKEKMPQVLFIADECHEMFNTRGSKNSALFREMADIIEKIAREGRSQGVHLIMATQTLADAEISSEIINNITDYYLFKCSVGDSERLVRDSSKKTGTLTTGHALYAGMHEREVLKSYFTSNEDAKVLMPKIATKAKQHKDNRVCYFNGTQLFPFDMKEVKIIKKLLKGQPLVALGYNISLQHEAIRFPLTREDSENILIFGINDDQQVTRTTLNATVSLLMSLKAIKKATPIYLMDFLGLEEGIYSNLLQCLKADKQVTIVKKSQQAQILSQLSDNIIHKKEQDAVLVILGQERFSALKFDKELEFEMKVPQDTQNTLFGNISFNTSVQGSGKNGKNMKVPHTYREAIELILKHGPVHGIHTIIQIDTPEKILFGDYVSPRQIASMFNHLVMLRSKNNIAPKLGLEDDIRLERLSSTPERLRAYYYHAENSDYKLFTPYTQIENFNLTF